MGRPISVTQEGLHKGDDRVDVTSQLEPLFASFWTTSSSPSSRPRAIRVELDTTGWEERLEAQVRVHDLPELSFNSGRANSPTAQLG